MEGQDKAAALRHAKIDLLAKYGRQARIVPAS